MAGHRSQNAAIIGARVHSGWAAVLAVAVAKDRAFTVIDRRRIVVVDPAIIGASQPYHFVEDAELRDAEQYLANCSETSERLAAAAIHEMAGELRSRGFEIAGCAIVMAAGRPLPPLPGILASHALIHTAEGEFFRRILRSACERQGIAVTGIREKDLGDRGKAVFGAAVDQVIEHIATMGRSLGPPWTQDQKAAALAASIVLAEHCSHPYSKASSPPVD